MMIDGIKIAVGSILATAIICGIVLGQHSKPVPSPVIAAMPPQDCAIREAILAARVSPADQLEQIRSKAGTNVIVIQAQVQYCDLPPQIDETVINTLPSDGDARTGIWYNLDYSQDYKCDTTEIHVLKSK